MPRNEGDKFRDEIAGLLAAKFENVRTEVYLSGKKADIFFREPAFPVGERRIAIECKALETRSITSSLISKVRSEYDAAFKNNEIDILWIISKGHVEALPKKTASAYGSALQVFSFRELQNSMMDFREYLRHLIKNFEKDGLSNYYVETYSDDRKSVHDEIVVPWLAEAAAKPLAFFGGYGMGKSSYAKRLAAWLAESAMNDISSRIPVLIRLGELTQAQNIRDLITVEFAAEHRVPGFEYALFSHLNSLGRFVIIFDGFDEMKHAMRSRDIWTNLNNIMKFILPASKVVIFGRPDPLVTAEDEMFFKGQRTMANGEIASDPSRPEFQMFSMDVFSLDEARNFIAGYIKWTVENNSRGVSYDPDFLTHRLTELEALATGELIRRPVHAKILADLALIPEQNIKISSEYELYREFIFRISNRETEEKAPRADIGTRARIEFMLDIAWWLWSVKKAESFSILEVPDPIATKWLAQFEEPVDRETALREMLIGSVLERSKLGDVFETKDQVRFFFPHRSYWEFLVAEFIAARGFCYDGKVIAEATSERIDDFIRQRADRTFFVDLGRLLGAANEKLPIDLIDRISRCQNQADVDRLSKVLAIDGAKDVHSIDVVMFVLACARSPEPNWTSIDLCIESQLLKGNVGFDCAFLGTLSWAAKTGVTSLSNPAVRASWEKIAILCVLSTYDDWINRTDPGLLSQWLKSGRFPHAKTLIQRIAMKHHSVTGSQFYAAGSVFGKCMMFKRKTLLESESLIKLNVSFVCDVLAGATEGVRDFGPQSPRPAEHFVEVDVNNVPAGAFSPEQCAKLVSIVERGKWAIDQSG